MILYILHSWLLKEKHLYGKRWTRGQIAAKASLHPEAGEVQNFVIPGTSIEKKQNKTLRKPPSMAHRQNLLDT